MGRVSPTAQLHSWCSCRSWAVLSSRCLCTQFTGCGKVMISIKHSALGTPFKYRVMRFMFISSLSGVSSLVLPLFFVYFCVKPTPDVARATPTSARRRRERRIRSFFRHEQMAVQMAVVSAQHHSAQRCRSIASQTDDFVPAATCAATASPAATYAATAASPTVGYMDPAPVVTYAATAPVIEHIAPAPAMTYVVPSQQVPPAYTTTTDTTDDNFDITDLVHTQFSSTAVEPFSPHVVGPLSPLKEFTEPRVQPSPSGTDCCR